MTSAFLRLWGQRPAPIEVRPGHRYCRRRRDNVTETATVTDLRPDAHGIPHVRFVLSFEERSIGRIEEGMRVLALPSFVAAYQERVA
jgi:hypothetical protein